jgi:hypothetical protein
MFQIVACHAAACQVHPNHHEPIVDIESRIVSGSVYNHVPMTHASVPIGITPPSSPTLFFFFSMGLIYTSAMLPSAASANFGDGGAFLSASADQRQTLPPGVPETWAPEYGEPQ